MNTNNAIINPFTQEMQNISRKSVSISGPRQTLKSAGLRAGMQMADLGCGSGFFTIPAAQIVGEDYLVYAVDILKPALEHVRSRAKLEGLHNIKTVWANLDIIGSTKLAAGAVDFAFIASALFETQYPERFLEEAKRILKPSGTLVIVEWDTEHMPIGPRPEHRIGEEDVTQLGRKAGLNLTRRFRPGSYHYGLVFAK